MDGRVGIVYNIPPEPPDPEACRWFEAGAVRFGLEYRDVTPEALEALYKDNPEHLAEMLENSPEGGFADCGVSIHVSGAADDHEYLRFDAFDADPHYHYVRPTGDQSHHNHWVPFDPVAGGDMLDFAFRSLRERLAPMLTEAGGERVAGDLDPAVQSPVIDEVEQLAYEVREKQRAATAGAGAAS